MAPMASKHSDEEARKICTELYEACQEKEAGKLFNQDEFLALGVVPNDDLKLLTECLNTLGNDGLLKLMTKDGRACWKTVTIEAAAKYRDLSPEEQIVYSYVDGAGREGIWTKTIRSKSNLHQIVFARCLKSLEHKSLIKPINTAKFPARKLYILSHLQPFEDVSGGPFFTDGILDEEFVHQLCLWVERYVRGRSWCHGVSRPTKRRRHGKMTTEEAEALRVQYLQTSTPDKSIRLLPMPPGYISYPKVPEITKAMNDHGLSSVTMKEGELSQLLDLLCWDGRLVKVMNGQAYKSVRPPSTEDEESGNSLVESPCGRCPVFDLCEEGSPVNASSCTYFQDWLKI